MEKVGDAKSKALRTLGQGCTASAHDAVIELITFQADLTQLTFVKLDGIYESLGKIERALGKGRRDNGQDSPPVPRNWSDVLKVMAVRTPYALAVMVVVLILYLWAMNVHPVTLLAKQPVTTELQR